VFSFAPPNEATMRATLTNLDRQIVNQKVVHNM
jgi:hypothetical protein